MPVHAFGNGPMTCSWPERLGSRFLVLVPLLAFTSRSSFRHACAAWGLGEDSKGQSDFLRSDLRNKSEGYERDGLRLLPAGVPASALPLLSFCVPPHMSAHHLPDSCLLGESDRKGRDLLEWKNGVQFYMDHADDDMGTEEHANSAIAFFVNGECDQVAFSPVLAGTYYPAGVSRWNETRASPRLKRSPRPLVPCSSASRPPDPRWPTVNR